MGKAETQVTTKQTRHWAIQVGLGTAAYIFAYLAVSYAIDRGSILAYAVCFILLVAGTRFLVLALRDSWRRHK